MWSPPPSPLLLKIPTKSHFSDDINVFDKTSQIPDTCEFPSTERLRVPGGRDLVPFLVFDQCAHDVFNLFSGSCRESPRHQNRDRIARNVGKSLSEEGDEPELGLLKSRRWFSRTCSREPPLFLCLQARPAPTTSRAVEASWRALLTAAAVASSPDLDSPGILSEQKSSGPASREPLLQGFMSAER